MDKNVGIPKPLSRNQLTQKLADTQLELRSVALKTIMYREVMATARKNLMQGGVSVNKNALTILSIKIDTIDMLLLAAFEMPPEYVRGMQNKIYTDPELKKELDAEVKALTTAIVPSTIITPGDRRWNTN